MFDWSLNLTDLVDSKSANFHIMFNDAIKEEIPKILFPQVAKLGSTNIYLCVIKAPY